MSYIINKSDGTVLTEIVDGTIDQTSTCLTLFGKNSSSYGEFLNENFVHLLENFASDSSPIPPRVGQTWYDTSEGRLKVYDGSGFKVSGGTIISTIIPETITDGDLWIDSENQQIHFNDGTNTVLAGPIYTAQQGISGFSIEDVFDSNNIKRTIAKLYVAQSLIGIFSKVEFEPKDPIPGFAGTVKVGFTIGSDSSLVFDVIATRANSLVSYHPITGELELKTASSFVSTTNDSTSSGTLTIQNTTPLILGPSQNNEVNVSTGLFQINSNISDQNFEINTLNSLGLFPCLHATAQTQFVGIYTDSPTSTLDVNGDVRVRGDLLVEGNTTTINTTNISIEDLLIEIGKVATPTNLTAEGGGISLQAGLDGNKTLVWNEIVGATGGWSSSEHFNIASGKSYHIGNAQVLTSSSLGSGITSALGLTSIGTLTSLQVDNLNINGNTISSTNTNGNIVLNPEGTGDVDVNSNKIVNLADPTKTSTSTDAVNYQTLYSEVRTKSIGFSLDTTGFASDAAIASDVLDIIFPSSEYDNETKCRVHCISSGVRENKLFIMTSGNWVSNGLII